MSRIITKKVMPVIGIGLLLLIPTALAETGKAPKIIFEHTLYDFGYAGPGQKIKHNFRFTNKGDAKLIIEKVTVCCGCSAELVPVSEVLPGEGAEIQSICTMPRHEDVHKKTFTVISNDPAADKIDLAVTGRVKRGIAVVPQGINLGKIEKGKTVSGYVKLLQLSQDKLVLEKVDANDTYFMVKTHRFEGENHRGYHIDVSLKPNLSPGRFNEMITLHTSMKRKPRIDVPVWAEILD